MSERPGLLSSMLLLLAVGFLPAPAFVKGAVVVSLAGMF
jgi:hypothetical protein